MPGIPIFVISLDDSIARYQNVEKGLSRFGLLPIRVRAVDGRRKAPLLKRAFKREFYCEKHGRPMSPGEIGCLVSHLKALRQAGRVGAAKAIILEDDVEFSEDFGAFYHTELPKLLDVLDVVKLEGIMFAHSSQNGLTVARGSNCRAIVPMRPSLGSAGYAVSRRGADSLAAVAREVSEPYDFILSGYERYAARYCEIRPFMARQSGAGSIIGDATRDLCQSRKEPSNATKSAVLMVRKVTGRVTSAGRAWVHARWARSR